MFIVSYAAKLNTLLFKGVPHLLYVAARIIVAYFFTINQKNKNKRSFIFHLRPSYVLFSSFDFFFEKIEPTFLLKTHRSSDNHSFAKVNFIEFCLTLKSCSYAKNIYKGKNQS